MRVLLSTKRFSTKSHFSVPREVEKEVSESKTLRSASSAKVKIFVTDRCTEICDEVLRSSSVHPGMFRVSFFSVQECMCRVFPRYILGCSKLPLGVPKHQNIFFFVTISLGGVKTGISTLVGTEFCDDPTFDVPRMVFGTSRGTMVHFFFSHIFNVPSFFFCYRFVVFDTVLRRFFSFSVHR